MRQNKHIYFVNTRGTKSEFLDSLLYLSGMDMDRDGSVVYVGQATRKKLDAISPLSRRGDERPLAYDQSFALEAEHLYVLNVSPVDDAEMEDAFSGVLIEICNDIPDSVKSLTIVTDIDFDADKYLLFSDRILPRIDERVRLIMIKEQDSSSSIIPSYASGDLFEVFVEEEP
jgi:hypothetical protein